MNVVVDVTGGQLACPFRVMAVLPITVSCDQAEAAD
jgi:hypothetical protein